MSPRRQASEEPVVGDFTVRIEIFRSQSQESSHSYCHSVSSGSLLNSKSYLDNWHGKIRLSWLTPFRTWDVQWLMDDLAAESKFVQDHLLTMSDGDWALKKALYRPFTIRDATGSAPPPTPESGRCRGVFEWEGTEWSLHRKTVFLFAVKVSCIVGPLSLFIVCILCDYLNFWIGRWEESRLFFSHYSIRELDSVI